MSMYRPRGTLAKAIHAKFHNDSFIEGFDTTIWYHIAKELPAKYQCKYVSFDGPDETTLQWLERAKSQASNIWVHIWHALARSVLQFFMTQTDINGWLKRGSMFILSEKQFEELLNASGFKVNCTEPLYLLDIGAGDGEISIRLRNAIEHTLHKNCDNHLPVRSFATETSWTMRDRLKKLNFEVLENLKNVSSDQFQLIACLNVLDRCIDPHELLMEIYTALASNGRAVFALVLPYVHYVEMNSSHLPIRPLMNHWPEHAKKLPFETEAACFLELLENCGFQIEAWTKAPYLCEGDLHQSYYWLTDFIVVVSKRPTAASAF